MANTVILNGYFGVKQSFWVSDPDVTTGWYEGQLFQIDSIGTSGAGTLKGAVGTKGPFVGLNDSSGAAITGVALEGSDEQPTAYAGMQHPSGSKVTLLHGHSAFYIRYGGTATNAATRQTGGAPWTVDLESASLMALLYASGTGKFSPFNGAASSPHPIGYLSQVPSAGNNWTMGVVLFG